MIKGIGTDLLKIDRLSFLRKTSDDPFIRATYTEKEIQQARLRPDPLKYYATRFAGKEAVFKALQTHPDGVRLSDIEILGDDIGLPYVNLHGPLRQLADQKGITQIFISLSYEDEYALAYATAIGTH